MIYVAYFSPSRKEAIVSGKNVYGKQHSNQQEVLRDASHLKHSFLTTSPSLARKVYTPPKFPGVVFASLLIDRVEEDVEKLHLKMDGQLTGDQVHFSIELLSEVLPLGPEQISIDSGDHYDLRCRLVNFADAKAYNIFDTRSIKNLSCGNLKQRAKMLTRKDLGKKLGHLSSNRQKYFLEGIL